MAVPEGYVALDLVGFTDKGNYSAIKIYMKNDLTHWKNTVWKCLLDNTVNVEPGKNIEAWEIFIEGEKPYYDAYANFPRPGEPERFYVDNTVDPRLMYTWDSNLNDYVLTGGAGGADGGSVDIPLTLIPTKWEGTEAPYSQEIILPQMREEMTPLHFLSGDTDEMRYAYSLITDYEAGYGKITFYASDKPIVNIELTLKGIPAQEVEYVDNTIIVYIYSDRFNLNESTGRYEQIISVDGMIAGTGGSWEIVRSGDVLSIVESKIAADITDVDRLDGAIKITCIEMPSQNYMISLSGTYIEAQEGDVLLKNMQSWFNQVQSIEENVSDEFSEDKDYEDGRYCIYRNKLYKFTSNKLKGPWDGEKVVPCTIAGELSELNSKTGKQIQYMDAIIPSISIDGTRGDTYYASFSLADKDILIPGTPLSITIIRWNGMPQGGLSYIFDYDFNNMVVMSVKPQYINNVKLRIVYIPD